MPHHKSLENIVKKADNFYINCSKCMSIMAPAAALLTIVNALEGNYQEMLYFGTMTATLTYTARAFKKYSSR